MAEDTFADRLSIEVDYEKAMLTGVATGEINIQTVNDEYKRRRKHVRTGLRSLALDDPNPWPDLWFWWGYCRERDELSSYQARREHIIRRYQPLLDALDRLEERQLGTGISAPETGWSEVDDQVRQLRQRYATAQTAEDYRAVGLLCRDILISLGYVVFDPDSHLAPDAPMPKRGDAKNRIDLMLASEFSGETNEKLRALVRATWAFVQPVVHARTDTEKKARLAANGTLCLVDILITLMPEPVVYPDGEFDSRESEPEENLDEWEPGATDLAYYVEHMADHDYEDLV